MNILLFGIARDIVGDSKVIIAEETPKTVDELKHYLFEKYPRFKELSSLAIAVNSTYAEDHRALNSNDEIAIIPPVSGG